MFRLSSFFAAVAVAAMAFAAPALAADRTVVRVALLDMSAVAPDQPVIGMMGQTMSPGTVAPGMMNRGGFGLAGMGLMAIRIDQSTIKAGAVTFDVTNWSRGMIHEMLVVPVDNANASLPYDYAAGRVMEDQIKALGETGEMQPNESKTLDLTLSPGTYLLLCNVAGHYAAGMVVPITVAP